MTAFAFGAAAFALYTGVVFYNAKSAADLGGPLNFIIIPLFVAALAAAMGLFVFLPLTLVAERFRFARWLQVFGALSVVSIGGVIVAGLSGHAQQFVDEANAALIGTAIMWLVVVEGFTLYLVVFALIRRFF